jgi:hypothetical protein
MQHYQEMQTTNLHQANVASPYSNYDEHLDDHA